MGRLELRFKAYGHENIKARHKSTFEITKDRYVSPRGDCIIAVKSEYAVSDLPENFKKLLKMNNSMIIIKLEVEDIVETIHAYGSQDLLLESDSSIVVRRSSYIDSRTLAIKADKAAIDINRELINKLKNSNKILKITLIALNPIMGRFQYSPKNI